MEIFKLPDELEKERSAIDDHFAVILTDFKKYNDQIIPENKEFGKRVIKFIISVVDYMIDNFDSIDLKGYQKFLSGYYNEFCYGPEEDESNYLNFDEGSLMFLMTETMDFDKIRPNRLKKIRKECTALLKQL